MSNPRIIAGKAKGVRLNDVPGNITRPITDRVKEALFNIIGNDIYGATFLDLFGGTGSVGLEALSRGADWLLITDLNRPAIQTIQSNILHAHLDASKAKVMQIDAFNLLGQNPDRSYDYIFIAPPQYHEMWIKAVQCIENNLQWLSSDGWVIVQIDPVEYKSLPLKLIGEFDQRKYGSTLLVFYRKTE